MPRIKLAEAVERIRNDVPDSSTNDSPGHFLVLGAGISTPEIPSASEIVKDLSTRTPGLSTPEGTDPYEFWVEKAFGKSQAKLREYIGALYRGRRATLASFKIASLLASRKLGDVAVTFNFDDMLERSLRLITDDLIVFDHPYAVQLDLERKDVVQLVHVHGSHQHYTLLSTAFRTQPRASVPNSGGAGEAIADLLRARSPIVLGYSGIRDDVFMQALRARLCPQRLIKRPGYWFCYRARDWETIPADIRDHDQMLFCVPEDDEVSPAEVVAGALVSALGVSRPSVLESPVSNYSSRLSKLLPISDDAWLDVAEPQYKCLIAKLVEKRVIDTKANVSWRRIFGDGIDTFGELLDGWNALRYQEVIDELAKVELFAGHAGHLVHAIEPLVPFNVKSLNLWGCPVRDLRGLERLQNLEELSLYNTLPLDISVCLRLPKLRTLMVTPLQKAQCPEVVAELAARGVKVWVQGTHA